MVPGPLWISPASSATSSSGAGDLRGTAYVVRPAVVLTGGNGGHWRVRGRNWCVLFSAQASRKSTMLYVCSSEWTWKGVVHPCHAPLLFVSGAVPVAGGSR